jgi:Ca2+-binding EF-hand superfamily protein|tara:strand:- start:18 stop:767 length:750 start_codon:yes stop_codon:yes gene_type:complete
MGNTHNKLPHGAMKKARKYFEAHEIKDVMSIFQNLKDDDRLLEGKSDSTHAGIDIETFGEYFSYPGVLREQIFKVFDTNQDGLIDREEFMRGLAMCCRGGLDEKLSFCFSMFDLSGDGFVDKPELRKCLRSTAFASFALLQAVAVEQGFITDDECLKPEEFEKEVDSMVEDAFDASDHNGDNQLSFEEFKRWMVKTPEVSFLLYFFFLFVYLCSNLFLTCAVCDSILFGSFSLHCFIFFIDRGYLIQCL